MPAGETREARAKGGTLPAALADGWAVLQQPLGSKVLGLWRFLIAACLTCS